MIKLGRLTELSSLYTNCLEAEKRLNDNIFQALVTLRPEIFKKKFPTHGWYIKNLLTGFNNISSYEEISGDINQDGIMRDILMSISKNPQTLIDLGMGALYADFKKNMSQEKGKIYAVGNLSEAKRFTGLYNMLHQSFPGAEIKDTAPKNFGESVLYDMQIMFPFDFTNQLMGKFNINIENKAGITNSAATSSFHFGTVSNQAITGGDLTYKSLLDGIQQISYKYLNGLSFADSIIELQKLKNRFMRELTIQYIIWRLENNYPVFTSSAKDGVVLCSEIINQMIATEKISFGEDTQDPGDKILRYYDSYKYIDNDTVYENKTFQNLKKTGIDNVYRSLKSVPEVSASLDKLIKDGKKVSPSFKISLWYGK